MELFFIKSALRSFGACFCDGLDFFEKENTKTTMTPNFCQSAFYLKGPYLWHGCDASPSFQIGSAPPAPTQPHPPFQGRAAMLLNPAMSMIRLMVVFNSERNFNRVILQKMACTPHLLCWRASVFKQVKVVYFDTLLN